MVNEISELQVIPIKPKDGLVGFASFVLNKSFYMSGIGIFLRPTGTYRLAYPTRKQATSNLNVFYPINSGVAEQIKQAVVEKFEEVTNLY